MMNAREPMDRPIQNVSACLSRQIMFRNDILSSNAVKHYNSISPEIKLCKTVEKFKRSLKADLLK